MISKYFVKNYCKDDISLIENFDKAFADKEQIWDCHHRRELETPRKELIEIGQYYNRPASELIFLTHAKHSTLHKKGKKCKPLTEETKQKMSESHKGKTRKPFSEYWKINIGKGKLGYRWWNNGLSELQAKDCPEGFVRGRLKGKTMSEDHKQKISEAHKVLLWFNNGVIEVQTKECPEGFVKGRLKKAI